MTAKFHFDPQDPSGRLTFSRADDGRTVSIKIDAESIGVPEVEDLIVRLGILRAQMTPAVPVSIDEAYAAPVPYLDNLHMWRNADNAIPAQAGALIVARSPMYGYLQFPASAEFCSGLVDWLQGVRDGLAVPTATKH